MKNSLLLKLLFPFMFGLNETGDEGGGGGDDNSDKSSDKNSDSKAGDDANDSAGDDANADADKAAEIKLPKKEYDRLVGRLGDLEAKDRQRAADAKKKAEEEKIEQGKLQEVLDEKEKTISELSPFKERYLKRLANDNKKILTAIEKADEKIKSRFKIPEAGKELTLEEIEHNIAKFEEFKELGILSKGSDGKTVVVPKTETKNNQQRIAPKVISKYDQ